MQSDDNKRLVQHVYAEISKGNPMPLIEAMADDVCWTLAGSTPFSGTFRGKHEVLEQLFKPLGALLENGIAFSPERFVAEGDHVVMQAQGRALTKTGKPYNNVYCVIIRCQNGKLREVTEYMDTELVTRVLVQDA